MYSLDYFDVQQFINCDFPLWKMQSDVWGTVNASEFHTLPVVIFQSANTINGYVDLWAQSSQVIQSYGSALSAYGLIFQALTLSGHSVLCSYLVVVVTGKNLLNQSAHNKLKVAPAIQPRALSITQGRAVGVAHYLLVVLQQLGL
jgi:photosystem I P700 chlorophyll a apoprotein A1